MKVAQGVDRGDAIVALTYLYAQGAYVDVIDRMESTHSPIECKTFELSPWDK